jgi:NitT/TauT family transport system permease protein
VALKTVESLHVSPEEVLRPARFDANAGAGLRWPAVLAPALLAGVALLIDRFLPNQQDPPLTWVDMIPAWRHPYPLVLQGILGLTLLAALAQWVWRPLRSSVAHYTPLLALPAGILMLWELFTVKLNWLKLPHFPGPDSVFAGMVEHRDILFTSTWHSLLLLMGGYAAGVFAGLVTGVLIGWFPRARYWGMPVLKVVGPIPATALIPVVMTLSTYSFISGVALIAFAVWFPVTMLTASGIANVRLSYLDVARTLGAGRWYLIFRVALPAALPQIFIGVFMGLIVSFLALVVAEGVGVQDGLGWYIKWQQGYVEYAKVWGAVLVIAVFCSGILTLLFKARDYVLAWQKGVIRW